MLGVDISLLKNLLSLYSRNGMGIFYICIAFSFVIIFITNIAWMAINLYWFGVDGIHTILTGTTFVENIYYSTYLKWILIIDGLWLVGFFVFLLQTHYKTNSIINFLHYNPILLPKICVIIHAYNEEKAIELVVKDFSNQEHVEQVIVIDNHSTDSTVEIAKKCGAKVITKDKNRGYAHSWVIGQQEALKTNANVIVITDADGTFNAYDMKKMNSYLDNADMVVGTRMVQVLSEKQNQNTSFLVWGNDFIAKLFQIKYFIFKRISAIRITDVGCSYRCFRREALEKIIDKYANKDTGEFVFGVNDTTIGLFTTSKVLENKLRIVEVPITFNKRIGTSKTRSNKKAVAFKYGLQFIWFILRS